MAFAHYILPALALAGTAFGKLQHPPEVSGVAPDVLGHWLIPSYSPM